MPIKRLDLVDVAAGYGAISVTRDVSLSIGCGEVIGILGRNGAGKTTTLASIVGLAKVFSGSICFDGHPVDRLQTFERSRAGLGYVPQGRQIFHTLSVEENIRAAASAKDAARALEAAYTLFPRLKERRSNGGGQLSGGEQQMLAIARALATFPSILLLDEPLEGLAPMVRQEVMHSIRQMVDQFGMGCVLVEQYVDVVLAFCPQVLVIESGSVVYTGATSELISAHRDVLDSAVGIKQTKQMEN
jgi:branched-chain amino acid transport system ATP-binding protein